MEDRNLSISLDELQDSRRFMFNQILNIVSQLDSKGDIEKYLSEAFECIMKSDVIENRMISGISQENSEDLGNVREMVRQYGDSITDLKFISQKAVEEKKVNQGMMNVSTPENLTTSHESKLGSTPEEIERLLS